MFKEKGSIAQQIFNYVMQPQYMDTWGNKQTLSSPHPRFKGEGYSEAMKGGDFK